MDALGAECDKRSAQWIEEHKNDPCEICGAKDNVVIIPMGSLAKLTSICPACRERVRIRDEGFWYGFEQGRKAESAAWKRMPWWRRLFA